MPYNIDTFKLKKLKLAIPRDFDIGEFLAKEINEDWRDDIVVSRDLKTWNFRQDREGLKMSGHIEGDDFVVTELDCHGDFSGTLYSDCLVPLLRKFKGDIEAVCIWEGGDSVQRLVSKDGKIKESEIDL